MSLMEPGHFPTPELIDNILATPDFTEGLLHVATFTATTGIEAGFGVWSSPDGQTFTVSDVVQGTATYDFETDSDFEIVNLGPIILDETGQFRDDLTLSLHSHPEGHPAAPYEAMVDQKTFEDFNYRRGEFADFHKIMLFPSGGDTALYSRIAACNPGHVGAILSTDANVSLAGLLFYRHNLCNPPIVDPFDEMRHPSQQLMLPRMSEQGYTFIETDYSFETGKYSMSTEEIATALF